VTRQKPWDCIGSLDMLGTRKWNRWPAYKGWFCSEICQTWAVLGCLYAEH